MLVSLSPSDIQRLAQIVREETGNQVQEKNFSMLESRIRSHILKLGLTSMEQYWAHFKANEKLERSLLQSLMTTHYTFFFREFAHFEILDAWINDELPRLKAKFEKDRQPVRVWSAACSRGQEVYSLAMFLEINLFRKHGIPFEVLGTDIDQESVEHARNGVYPIQEVNTIPQSFVQGFWKRGTGPVKDFAAVHPTLKARVRFESLNLTLLSAWKDVTKFDVVFCRNVFIYFSEENVRKIALGLALRMQGRGVLMSGMSEPLRFSDWPLTSIGPSCYQNLVGQAASKPQAAADVRPPVAQKTAKHEVPPEESVYVPPQKPAEEKSYSVLCVDDSPTIQSLMKKIFSQDPSCKSIEIAGNGREAREKLNLRSYDLITLDIHMPEVTGIEFLEKHYDKMVDPPVIMVSSVNRSDIELATKSLALGAFDYVEKPAMNNLSKSADEILTKVKMALRSRGQVKSEPVGEFESSLSRQIVVPDASMCVRLIAACGQNMSWLEHVVVGQKNEVRSPALVIFWNEALSPVPIETQVLKWTNRPIVSLRDPKVLLRPNHVYIVKPELQQEALKHLKASTVSLQILDGTNYEFGELRKAKSLQVLVEESLAHSAQGFSVRTGLVVSDITPSTSFASLSLEFFAEIRKAAA